jgi:hypothetical protein
MTIDPPRIISRAEAKALGLKSFFTGKPCKHGHVAERYVSSRGCVECDRARALEWRVANREMASRLAITSSGCVAPASVLNGSASWPLRAAAGIARLLSPGGALAAPIARSRHPAAGMDSPWRVTAAATRRVRIGSSHEADHRPLPLNPLPEQLRHPRDVDGDPPRLVRCQHLGLHGLHL